MARQKKNGEFLSFYMDKHIADTLRVYAERNGQTLTKAIELILCNFFEENNISNSPDIGNKLCEMETTTNEKIQCN